MSQFSTFPLSYFWVMLFSFIYEYSGLYLSQVHFSYTETFPNYQNQKKSIYVHLQKSFGGHLIRDDLQN